LELKSQLFIIPEIVDKIQKKENESVDFLLKWLRNNEYILHKHGYAECAEMAGLRSKLLTPEFIDARRTVKKKEKLRLASEIIYDSQSIILRLIRPLEEKLNEARIIINQILLVVKPWGIIEFDISSDFTNFIQGIWLMLKGNEHVGGGISKVLTLVNQSDAIRILAEEIIAGE